MDAVSAAAVSTSDGTFCTRSLLSFLSFSQPPSECMEAEFPIRVPLRIVLDTDAGERVEDANDAVLPCTEAGNVIGSRRMLSISSSCTARCRSLSSWAFCLRSNSRR
ncbi:hypothetical protein TcG_09475 [Trypanosoma cruzi]|nr:hypothetical protein TcG_09475 [Trypanosoma cruzi]